MKHTVHVTVTYSVEVDPTKEGLTSKADVRAWALNNYSVSNAFDASAKIFDTYDVQPKVKRGKGSY